jgi:hypothetical protein
MLKIGTLVFAFMIGAGPSWSMDHMRDRYAALYPSPNQSYGLPGLVETAQYESPCGGSANNRCRRSTERYTCDAGNTNCGCRESSSCR